MQQPCWADDLPDVEKQIWKIVYKIPKVILTETKRPYIKKEKYSKN